MSVLRISICLFLAMLPGLCLAAPVKLPAALDGKPRELWRAVMTQVYGPYDATRKCWIGKKSADAYCMRPHKLDRATDNGTVKLYFAIGGSRVDSESCHACTGNLGLLVFEKQGQDYVLAAQNGLYDEAGSWGEVPAEESFGITEVATNMHGWVIESGYTAQGITGGGSEVFSPRGTQVVSLGYIPTFLDNCGAAEEGVKCDNYAFDLSFQPGSTPFHDALLQKSAKSDNPPGDNRFMVPFDAASGKYAVPKALEDLLAM